MPSSTTRKSTSTRAPRKRTAPTTSDVPTDASVGQDKYSPKTWGAGGGGAQYEDLTVPSGQLCLVRRPGLEGLLKSGIVHNFDTLTSLVGKQSAKMKRGKAEPDKADDEIMREILGDPKKLDEMTHMIDRITCYVVVKPELTMTPNDPTSRKNDKIYADMIELDDKIFIVNYALGGVRDLERFREQSEGALGSVGDQPEAESETQ